MSDHPELRTKHSVQSLRRPGRMRWLVEAIRRLLLTALLTTVPASARAQDQGPSTEGALFLLLPVSAKAVGLARTMTPQPGPESVWWNPAGLARVAAGGRVQVYRGDHPVAGAATALSLVLSRSVGAAGASYQLMDVGSQDVTDTEGNVIGTLTGRNHLGIVTLASHMGGLLALGANVKLVRFQLTCRGQCNDAGVSASSVAVDAGVQITHPRGIPLILGAMIAHAGSSFGTEQQADPLPTRARIAAAYEVLGHFTQSQELSLTVAAELESRWRDPDSPATYFGAEFAAGSRDALYIRAGYVLGAEQQLDGASVGVGLQYERFDIALAKSLASSPLPGESEPIHISFGFLF